MPGNFLDTNIIIYSFGQDLDKQDKALSLLAKKPVLLVQVLNEASNVMRRKLGYNIDAIRAVINRLAHESGLLETVTLETVNQGLTIAERYGLSYYDSLIVASALMADCNILHSEDMQHGQVFDGRLKVVNPFLEAC